MGVILTLSLKSYLTSYCFVLSSDISPGLFSHHQNKTKLKKKQAETNILEIYKKFS